MDLEYSMSWTPEKQSAWTSRREKYRIKKGIPPLAELRDNDPKKYRDALEMERKTLLSRLEKLTHTSLSWSLDKYPIAFVTFSPFKGKLVLPNNYHEVDGFSEIFITPDMNLNNAVYQFYQGIVPNSYPGFNFVTECPIVTRRHELLGPCPRVAGFRFNQHNCTIHVEWYDNHLREKWFGNTFWSIEAHYDESVEGWISKARGDFYQGIDREEEYLGVEI